VKKYVYAAMVGILLGTMAGIAGASTATGSGPVLSRAKASYRLPGHCVKVLTQEVKPNGNTEIRVQVLCERTEAINSRLRREGN
jgi:hypothetical protein